MITAFAWYVHGICVVCSWHIHGMVWNGMVTFMSLVIVCLEYEVSSTRIGRRVMRTDACIEFASTQEYVHSRGCITCVFYA